MESFCSDDIKELASAMLKVQSKINPAVRDASNPFAKSRYATLNSVVAASREALLAHGVWVSQYPVPSEPGHLGLVTRLTHAPSGQWLSCLMVMPLAKPDPQGFGSAMTYARRYSLASMVGLTTEDDDAEAACGRPMPPRPPDRAPVGRAAQDPPEPIEPANGNSKDQSSSEDLALLSRLPRLDGVSYEAVTAHDGRLCVVANGNTMSQRGHLKDGGFKWNPQRKIWWRYAEA
jgi:hypothetical protein